MSDMVDGSDRFDVRATGVAFVVDDTLLSRCVVLSQDELDALWVAVGGCVSRARRREESDKRFEAVKAKVESAMAKDRAPVTDAAPEQPNLNDLVVSQYSDALKDLGVPRNHAFLSSGWCEDLCGYIGKMKDGGERIGVLFDNAKHVLPDDRARDIRTADVLKDADVPDPDTDPEMDAAFDAWWEHAEGALFSFVDGWMARVGNANAT